MTDSITSYLATAAFGLIIYVLVKLWLDYQALPPGPYPLPVLGNLLMFMRKKRNLLAMLEDLNTKYNGIYTLWLGSVPFVVVARWDLVKEGLITKRNDIISRPELPSLKHQLENQDAVVFEGNTKKWEVLRKVGAAAIRKFSDSDTLAMIIRGSTEETVEKLLAKDGPFDPRKDIQELSFSIIAKTAFGAQNISTDEMDIFAEQEEIFHGSFGLSPGDFLPLLRPLFYFQEQSIKTSNVKMGEFLRSRYQTIKDHFQTGDLRHFTDSLIVSSSEAKADDSQQSEYLTDDNMKKLLGDLFLAGTDTSTISLVWCFLHLAQFPIIQSKIRKEIDENIGSRMPVADDRINCSYTWSFISEILRIRTPVPLLIPHTANVDTSLGEFSIPKGTNVIFDTAAVHSDPNLWPDPESFKPERFLDSEGRYENKRLPGYLPFGDGKRMCIGEKMARNNIFMVLATLMQKVEIISAGPPQTAALEAQNNPIISLAKNFEIYLKSRC